MGHTFTYYASLAKLTKSQEKSNIKLARGQKVRFIDTLGHI